MREVKKNVERKVAGERERSGRSRERERKKNFSVGLKSQEVQHLSNDPTVSGALLQGIHDDTVEVPLENQEPPDWPPPWAVASLGGPLLPGRSLGSWSGVGMATEK